MARNDHKKVQLHFGEDLTAAAGTELLGSLNVFLEKLQGAKQVVVDARDTQNIDKAGCQIIELAVLAARKKGIEPKVWLSQKAQHMLMTHGFTYDEGI